RRERLSGWSNQRDLVRRGSQPLPVALDHGERHTQGAVTRIIRIDLDETVVAAVGEMAVKLARDSVKRMPVRVALRGRDVHAHAVYTRTRFFNRERTRPEVRDR